ncbi:MAG: UvrD-helicase domain-containing protein [Aquabacterium sp.]
MTSMQHAAYEVDGQLVDPARFYEVACDPQRSVVVEACAGAGKTWMLVSRIVRALLDGVAPQHILAITFTKKAAGEMRERLHDWLAQFAKQSHEERLQELAMRGVPTAQREDLAPRLGQLHQAWMTSGRPVEIHTIHGWFSRLLKVAPLDVLTELQLPPELSLIEDQTELWPELWGRFLRRVEKTESQLIYIRLVQQVGGFNVEKWLMGALSNRMEIQLADQHGRLLDSIESHHALGPEWARFDHPDDALVDQRLRQRMQDLAITLGAAKGKLAIDAAQAMATALTLQDPYACGKGLCSALLTKDGTPKKKLGDLESLADAQDWLMSWLEARQQFEARQTHLDMCELSRTLFAEYDQIKQERGLADMVDLERAAARLLTDSVLAGWVQERLDGQTHQLLMDEFQDTSPLQWQTLKSWLEAYAGAGGGRSGQTPMRVFLVGDPKQSIYRFRRADPRVFHAAKQFVIDGLSGHLLACDHTRRNAPGIIDAMNRCMHEAAKQGDFPGFRTHTTASEAPSRIVTLPSILRSQIVKNTAREGWRDSLHEPREAAQISLRELEAQSIANAIAQLIDEGMKPSDIYVLARKRASLYEVAAALDERGINNLAPENALLCESPQVRDLVALVDALVSTHHDLSLAHALRSPILACTDDDLLAIALQAQAHASTWWQAVSALAEAQAGHWAVLHTQLQRWQHACHTLPPHDMLQQIVHESGLLDRLHACLGPIRGAAACAHVEALLHLTLDMDSGRDATPYRWIRKVRQSTATLPVRAAGDMVQLLTIHGAKGLEAEVVFLMDTDAAGSRAESYGLLVDWPEGAAAPQRCAFLRSESRPPNSLKPLLESEEREADREELNALYVALTRAKSQLVISRVEPGRQSSKPSWWSRLTGSGAVSPESPWVPEPAASHQMADEGPFERPALPTLPSLPEATTALQPKEADSDAQVLGQTVHKALEWLTMLPQAQQTAERITRATTQAAQQQELPTSLQPQAIDIVSRLLTSPALKPWLSPDDVLWAANEVTIHHAGQTLRLDRLVQRQSEQGKQWWVLDYKLNHHPDELAIYRTQMAQYVRALEALQTDEAEVKAAFITGAGEWISVS